MSAQAYKTGVTVSSTTLADLVGAGVLTGHIRHDETDGSSYRLCKVGAAAIADGLCAKKDATTSLELTVIKTTAIATSVTLGINNTGGEVAIGAYFWAKMGGVCYCDGVAAGWNDGDAVTGGVAGEMTVAVVGANDVFGVAMNDDSATITVNRIAIR